MILTKYISNQDKRFLCDATVTVEAQRAQLTPLGGLRTL